MSISTRCYEYVDDVILYTSCIHEVGIGDETLFGVQDLILIMHCMNVWLPYGTRSHFLFSMIYLY